MKNLWLFISGTLHMVLLALIISAIFTALKWLCSLTTICDAPGWVDFLGGAAVLFVCMFVYSSYKAIMYGIHVKKDPPFANAHAQGMSWRTWQRIKNIKVDDDDQENEE